MCIRDRCADAPLTGWQHHWEVVTEHAVHSVQLQSVLPQTTDTETLGKHSLLSTQLTDGSFRSNSEWQKFF